MIDSNQARAHRPTSVTILAFGVLILSVINFASLRSIQVLWSEPLQSFMEIPPWYLVVRELVWGLLGLIIFLGLWRGVSWAPNFTRLIVFLYVVVYWLERFILIDSQNWTSNWAFTIVLQLLFIFIICLILSRPNSRAFFGDENE